MIEFSKETMRIFDLVLEGEILCIYSSLCEQELILAPSRISKLVEKIPLEFKQKILDKDWITKEMIRI
mgnify:CR=1 FL=1